MKKRKIHCMVNSLVAYKLVDATEDQNWQASANSTLLWGQLRYNKCDEVFIVQARSKGAAVQRLNRIVKAAGYMPDWYPKLGHDKIVYLDEDGHEDFQ